MSGASDAHGTAALNLAALLRNALRGTPCKPFIADMKVQVAAANSFYYPDILVTCDPRDRTPEASHVKQHPCLIVEVLSPSTEAYDRTFSVPGNALWDSRVAYKINQEFTVAANLNNMFDKKYYTNIGFYDSAYYGDPRNVMVTTRWDF